MVTANYQTEMDRLQDSKPKIKVEFIDTSSTVTDISEYYLSGANFEQVKERAVDEIQAGSFDIELSNQDDNFSEFKSGSLLFGIQYIGALLRISLGFTLPDGTTEYTIQSIGIIDEIIANAEQSSVLFRCRDKIRDVMDRVTHERPASEKTTAGTNSGNGIITTIETKPFKTVSEDWTLTCTSGGGDGTGQFSVVGSLSGNVGTATSGTSFSTSDSLGGVKFTAKTGTNEWAIGDTFTFSTKKYPQWEVVNIIKILWSVLTGYNWDTDTQETWSDFVLALDSAQSAANADIDYSNFVAEIASVGSVKGYIPYNTNAINFIQDLLILIQGSIYSNTDGKIQVKAFTPTFASSATLTHLQDSTKITMLGYSKTVDEIINYAIVNYKGEDTWEFSDETVILDETFIASDATSIAAYEKLVKTLNSRWFSPTGNHVNDLGDKIVEKLKDPTLNINLKTGLDATLINIGDTIKVTDAKYGFSSKQVEVARVIKNFDEQPISIGITGRSTPIVDTTWGFLGSSADEGDGASPQSSGFDAASSSDLDYCYLSQNGGGDPDYRMF